MSKKTFTMKNKKASKVYKCDGQLLRKIITGKGFMPTDLSRMMDYCSDYLNSCTRKNKISDVCVKKLMDYKIFPQMYGVEGEIKVDEPKEIKIDKDEQKYVESDKKAVDELRKRMDRINENSTYGIPKPDKGIEFATACGVVRSEKDLRDCIKRATDPKAPVWRGSNLIIVREILEKAYNNGLKYNVEDMRNDLLVYASNTEYPETWVHFVERLNLVNDNNSLYEAAKDALNAKTCQKAPFEPTVQEVKKVLNEKYGRLDKGVEGIDYGYGPAPKNPSYYAASHDIAKGVFKLMQAAMDDLKHDREFKEMIKQAVKEAYEEL